MNNAHMATTATNPAAATPSTAPVVAARDLRQTYFDAIPRRMAAVVSAAGGE